MAASGQLNKKETNILRNLRKESQKADPKFLKNMEEVRFIKKDIGWTPEYLLKIGIFSTFFFKMTPGCGDISRNSLITVYGWFKEKNL